MEFDFSWLMAIPLFFGLGWFASRLERRGARRAPTGLPDAYFRGLNFLLSEQPDKAIDAFIDVVKLDPETIELHFALGNLFRRRGETERAIRVHLNLAERAGIDPQQREHALFELGQDYLKAGLLDRAEDAFNRLEGGQYAGAALRHRLQIAQMVRDWPQAIALAARLQRDPGQPLGHEVAHFHCELAAQALASGDADRFEQARRHLRAATAVDSGHPRPALLAGELALAEGDAAAAIRAWSRLENEAPEYLALVADGWMQAHERVGQPGQGAERLLGAMRDRPSFDVFAAIASAQGGARGDEAGLDWAESALRARPSLLSLERVLGMRAARADESRREEIALMQQLIAPHARNLARFACSKCGFKARRHYWQCPGCAAWDTYAPRRVEELERG